MGANILVVRAAIDLRIDEDSIVWPLRIKGLAQRNIFFDTEGVHRRTNLRSYVSRVALLGFVLVAMEGGFVQAQQPPAQSQPANAAGKWTLYCKDPNGATSAKYLDLQQKGAVITGHFKGPNQSGGVAGTIDEQHLVVRTRTRDVLVFRGRVDGPRVDGVVQGASFSGTFHDRGGTGSFQGQRSN
jgi:hypothetical protein